jgi:hypothetical protein
MVDWQLTATSIYCEAVDDDVTIIVNGDRTTSCTGHKKYVDSITKEVAVMIRKKSKKLGRDIRCEGPLDYRVVNYRDKLFSEDNARSD